ncbi:MAG: hypothetical protein RR240_07585 [Burkholderiaceae bacterium]
MADEPNYVTERWSKYFDEIDQEIVRLAVILEVRILEPGVIERILKGDATVCGRPREASFEKLRGLLTMHYSTRAKAIEALGPEAAIRIVHETVARLRARLGGGVGSPLG